MNKKVIIRCVLALSVILFQTVTSSARQPVVLKFPEYYIVIYGGTSAGVIAAVHAIEEGCPVQDVDYDRLKERLVRDGQRL